MSNVKVGRDFDASESNIRCALVVFAQATKIKGAWSIADREGLLRDCAWVGGNRWFCHIVPTFRDIKQVDFRTAAALLRRSVSSCDRYFRLLRPSYLDSSLEIPYKPAIPGTVEREHAILENSAIIGVTWANMLLSRVERALDFLYTTNQRAVLLRAPLSKAF